MLDVDQVKAEVLDRVIQEITTILGEKSLSAEGLTAATPFAEISFISLDLAELVSNVEDHYDVDPFEEMVAITSIVTVGDFAAAYSECLTGEVKDDALTEELRAIKNKVN